jgi:hypothetical protein
MYIHYFVIECLLEVIEEVSFKYIKVKVKLSHYRPGQTLRFAAGCGSQISRQSTQEGGKIFSLISAYKTTKCHNPKENNPKTHSHENLVYLQITCI